VKKIRPLLHFSKISPKRLKFTQSGHPASDVRPVKKKRILFVTLFFILTRQSPFDIINSTRVTRLGEFCFARWAIIYIGQFFENYIISPHCWTTFFLRKRYVIIVTKNGLGHILGEFFRNSSGHPVINEGKYK
jgi:hypothetical protein